jgi:hypothetical protein
VKVRKERISVTSEKEEGQVNRTLKYLSRNQKGKGKDCRKEKEA